MVDLPIFDVGDCYCAPVVGAAVLFHRLTVNLQYRDTRSCVKNSMHINTFHPHITTLLKGENTLRHHNTTLHVSAKQGKPRTSARMAVFSYHGTMAGLTTSTITTSVNCPSAARRGDPASSHSSYFVFHPLKCTLNLTGTSRMMSTIFALFHLKVLSLHIDSDT
jgi:hypothetical protein